MPGIPKLSLVEGSFEELASELATYLDSLKGEGSTVSSDITPLLVTPDPEQPEASGKEKETDKDAVLKKLVTSSSALNGAPERELQAAYNLLIHLISQSEEPENYLPPVCRNLTAPITSSPQNGTGIALGILGTLFNTLQPDDETRYHVLLAIVELVKRSASYETIRPQLANIDSWLSEWEMEPSESRKLYMAISDSASTARYPEESYIYLLKALRTLESEPATPEAREMSLKALRSALQSEKHFDFQDLTALDTIQSLRKSDETWSELLDVFVDQTFEDLADFKEANDTFIADSKLDEDVLDRKMRLLTLTTLAAQASENRTISYAQIAKSLRVSDDDTEMWVIDCIRSGLVEGKLSQQKQEFLIHRATHRTFGEKQWREVASRLDIWRASLTNVLAVIRQQKEEYVREKEAELSGATGGEFGGRAQYRGRNNRNQPLTLDME
ncbi:hypothetical protein LTR62_003745 [Meristemomyces frigidus]|uniref:Eukaryotic translation initiation factor 3 subunit M n=1 Tax=Meristemomyces frigidus TaxID=1508187 RepID=A0AAN7YKC9_9PEZI|nr:hypothetical protein LTR62_003745 [Meristemomyces frigidus]